MCVSGRSLMAKKNDGIKESTDSTVTIDEEDTKGRDIHIFVIMFWTLIDTYIPILCRG